MMTENQKYNEGHAYMERALQLSLLGGTEVSPNPYVGAVIVARNRIIGEGYHRRFGEAHAEVNAIASVREEDRPLLKESTMYVTLEPCSHHGKTPPCADLIIATGIPRVVIAATDPFLKIHGSGIDRMRAAGIEVTTGLLEEKARYINRRFFTAHEQRRPYVLLKWAQSADGFIAAEGGKPVRFSSPLGQVLVHRLRAEYDAILAGPGTLLSDNPRLDCRYWPCRDPEHRPVKVTFDSPRLKGDSFVEKAGVISKPADMPLAQFLTYLYENHGITSLLVEGGKAVLETFIREGFYDTVRIETSPTVLHQGVKAPIWKDER